MDEQRSVTDVPAATHRRPARGEEETRTTPSPAKLARLEPGIALVGLFVLSIVYTLYFLLATGDTFLRKLVQIVPGHPDKNRAVAMIRTIEGDIARYLSTVTFINAGLGAATAIAMYFLELVVGHRRRTDRGTDADGVEDRLRSRSEPRARRRTPERQARGTGD